MLSFLEMGILIVVFCCCLHLLLSFSVSVCLKFKFGASYPDEVPIFSIESSENLTDEDCSEILRLLQEEVRLSLPYVSVHTVWRDFYVCVLFGALANPDIRYSITIYTWTSNM